MRMKAFSSILILPLLILLLLLLLITTLNFSAYSQNDDPVITVTLVGDLYLGGGVEKILLANPAYPYTSIRHILSSGDILIGNLEAPLSEKNEAYIEKTYTLRCHPNTVQTLTAGGFDAVTLANNHIMDFGPSALQETLSVLDQNNIKYTGAGMNLQQARTPAILKKNGIKVAVLAYNNTLPLEFNASATRPGTAQGRWEYISQDIKNARSLADLVVVSFHWSAELLKEPKPYQSSLGKLCINSGAHLVFGHHPHVVQGIEVYKGGLIAYSLGNFIFGSYSQKVREAIILQVQMDRSGPRIAYVYPININNLEVKFCPRLLQGREATAFFSEFRAMSAKLGTNLTIRDNTGIILVSN